MFRRRFDFSWPFLCILVCLFILSVKSPRGWERVARREAIGPPVVASSSIGAAKPGRRSKRSHSRRATRDVTLEIGPVPLGSSLGQY